MSFELQAEPHHTHRVSDPTARPYDEPGLAPDADGRFNHPSHWSEVLDWRDYGLDRYERNPLPVIVRKVGT